MNILNHDVRFLIKNVVSFMRVTGGRNWNYNCTCSLSFYITLQKLQHQVELFSLITNEIEAIGLRVGSKRLGLN